MDRLPTGNPRALSLRPCTARSRLSRSLPPAASRNRSESSGYKRSAARPPHPLWAWRLTRKATATWLETPRRRIWLYAAAAQSHPAGSGLFRIDGAGNNWTNLYNSGAAFVSSVAVSAQHPQLALAASNQGIARTTDGGSTWSLALQYTQSPLTVAFDPTNDSLAYAAGGGWVFNSADGGVTWGGIGCGACGNAVDRIWVDPNNPQVLFSASGPNLQRNSASRPRRLARHSHIRRTSEYGVRSIY